ncbi:MAG: 1-(5-phosphoribosyl)-5-[(5-phosphoribosylamino)methylideneamino]imidazole-4-carboxamide isomerase [Ignavibacteriaceae bacterium]
MLIIPSIDIFKDKIVRLKKGDFNNITYYSNSPYDQAKLYESLGFKLVHIVDLEGSKTGKFTAINSIKEIKENTNLEVEFGGGIRSSKNVDELFSSGIDYVVIGSLSIKNKAEFENIVKNNPAGKIVAAADVNNEMIRVSGWTEETEISIYSHIDYCRKLGIGKFLVTDISRDGMLSGTNKVLYEKILKNEPGINLIASGGIKDLEDIKSLEEINPYGVIVGKAIYENKIDFKELTKFAL